MTVHLDGAQGLAKQDFVGTGELPCRPLIERSLVICSSLVTTCSTSCSYTYRSEFKVASYPGLPRLLR